VKPQLTKAEASFLSLKEKRMKAMTYENAEIAHRNKIETFNKYLEKLPVHFDIPRVGPG
jgi:protein FAM32A